MSERRTSQTAQPAAWRIARGRTIALDVPRVMGILNVTPDSFSDGGQFDSPGRAIDRAMAMIDEGAAIIDIGGESTRPGAQRVDAQEQIRRVVPVVEELRSRAEIAISIDTTLSAVAAAAIDAGADIINDVAAGTEDETLFALAAERSCGIVLMHRRFRPDEDSYSNRYAKQPHYDDVAREVKSFLVGRAQSAIDAGIKPQQIVIDPGLGFGKTVQQNHELIARTRELLKAGYPVLSAASRKSFIGAASGVDEPRERVAGSVAVSVAHYFSGVRLFRVHDVAAHQQALAVAEAIGRAAGDRE